MQLRALQEVFIRMERDPNGLTFYIDTEWIPTQHRQGYARVYHLLAGGTLSFKNIQAGDNPYQTLADNHPDLLVMEQDAPSD